MSAPKVSSMFGVQFLRHFWPFVAILIGLAVFALLAASSASE